MSVVHDIAGDVADPAIWLPRLLAETLATDPAIPSAAVAIRAPRLGLHWQSGADRESSANAAQRPFRIASVAKPFVAATLHRVMAREAIDLFTPIAALAAPETVSMLAESGYAPAAITIAHLLSHSSGLIDHSVSDAYAEAVFADPARRWTRHEQIALAMRAGPPLAPPGAVYSYSDTGYVILGEIVERLTGQSLAAAVRNEIGFGALGMTRTWWEQHEAPPADAPPIAPQFAGAMETTHFDASFDLHGGGGLISTVGDLARFAAALFDGTLFDARSLAALLMTPAAAPCPGGAAVARTHGYLASTFAIGGRWVLGHTGHWGTAMIYCPDLDLALAVNLNQSAARDAMLALAGTIVDRLAAPLLGRAGPR